MSKRKLNRRSKTVKLLTISFAIFAIFSITLHTFAIEVPDEWYYKAIETMARSEEQILHLQGRVDDLTDELVQKKMEVVVLEAKIDRLSQTRKDETRGVWVGGGSGYPFGVYGSFNYQFNSRFMVNSSAGYMDGFLIQVGFTARVRK